MNRDAFQKMMRKATRACKLVNVDNADLHAVGRKPRDPMAEAMARNVVLKIRPTTDEENLNKTEKAYLAWLETQGDLWIGVQCITLKLGADVRFTPDFWALDNTGLRAIDTKTLWGNGKLGVEEDARVKILVAARMFPFIRFLFAWREGAVWQHKELKP